MVCVSYGDRLSVFTEELDEVHSTVKSGSFYSHKDGREIKKKQR